MIDKLDAAPEDKAIAAAFKVSEFIVKPVNGTDPPIEEANVVFPALKVFKLNPPSTVDWKVMDDEPESINVLAPKTTAAEKN